MKTFNIFDAELRVRRRRTRTATTAGMDRFGPKIGAHEDRRARSTSSRPARRCARTTTRPTRSGCSCSRARLSVRHPDGDDVLGPGDVAAFPVGPEGAHKIYQRVGDETVRFIMLSTKDVPGVRGLPGLEQDRQSGPATRTSTCWSACGENLDYYDGETS